MNYSNKEPTCQKDIQIIDLICSRLRFINTPHQWHNLSTPMVFSPAWSEHILKTQFSLVFFKLLKKHIHTQERSVTSNLTKKIQFYQVFTQLRSERCKMQHLLVVCSAFVDLHFFSFSTDCDPTHRSYTHVGNKSKLNWIQEIWLAVLSWRNY